MSTKAKTEVAAAAAGERRLNMIEAINDALDIMLERDDDVIIMGEDVGYFGGVFRCTAGLQEKHGKTRVFDTPISECGIIGVAVGMGAYGLRPVPEIQFADYIYPGLDQLISEAARLRYRSANDYIAPLTVRSPFGGGIFGGQTHSQSPEAIFAHVSGLKTVIPSTPYDAKGLLISAIEDNDPVIFFEPKRIYNGPFSGYYDKPVEPWKKHPQSVVPEGYYKIPLGKARHVTEGEALTAWVDTVSGVEARTVGTPMLVENALGGRAAMQFDPSDDNDAFSVISSTFLTILQEVVENPRKIKRIR